MIADLCVSGNCPKGTLSRIIAQHRLFGYGIAAIETIFQPSPKATVPPPNTVIESSPLSSFHNIQASLNPPVQLLPRITIVLESRSFLHFFNTNSSHLRGYDLVAVRPTTEDTFRLACGELEVDVISIDLSQRLPFHLKHTQLKQALKRGVYFEIIYFNLLMDPDNSFNTPRMNFISNVSQLLSVTKGQNCFFSSGSRDPFDLRAPFDIMNLVSLFNLPISVGKSMVFEVPNKVLLHIEGRKAERSIVYLK
ncbi:hypothetical protein P9112_009064 [Eukaryota sp. TZLM1-RC]